jgi:uncharacterized protein (TIGR02145 family)
LSTEFEFGRQNSISIDRKRQNNNHFNLKTSNMQTKHLFLLPALAFLACAGLQAQVTIGSVNDDPAVGALLDLNSPTGNKGGLLLSNVSIADLSKIPTGGTNLFPGIIAGDNDNTNSSFIGAMVYHIGTPDIPAGIYIWNGVRWIPPGGCDCPEGTVADDECNCYSINKFGDAGIWMTQNLRSTEKDYGNGALLSEGNSQTTDKCYDYPGLNASLENRKAAFDTHKEYGLLYSWRAASGRTDANQDNAGSGSAGFGNNKPAPQDYRQGICPKGWHLPSDYEWSQLEKEIATNPGKYSTQTDAYSNLDSAVFFPYSTSDAMGYRPFSSDEEETYWGRQMKHVAGDPINGQSPRGSSKSHEEGGFDALLVGYTDGAGAPLSYGTRAYFWSSNSYITSGMYREVDSGNTGVYREYTSQAHRFCVRCKKD